MSVKTIHKFFTDLFSDLCVYDGTTNSTYITSSNEVAANKYNTIVESSCDPNIKSKVTIINVCAFMTLEQKRKVCREKGMNFYKFFN
jgi:hypothetical protein